jgi:hypothetical protein
MTGRIVRAIARDLDVEPRELIAESLRAVAVAPFLFAGFVAWLVLIAGMTP